MGKQHQSLSDFVLTLKPTKKTAWIESLPDEIFNEVWDAMHNVENTVGKTTIAKWLQSIGYKDATGGRVDAVLIRDRRK